MNEAQEKPKKKWHKIRPKIVVLLILACAITAIVVLLLGQHDNNAYTCYPVGSAYCAVKEDVQRAVTNYSETHNSSLPTLSGTYTNANCSACHIVNMSAMLVANGSFLRQVTDGTWQGPSTTDDNCDSLAGHISGCSASNHYIWIVDNSGTVYSYCVGAGCETNNSGKQDIWP